MTIHAAYDDYTEQYLRGETDDTYVRPIFSILDDDNHEDDDHSLCSICQTFDYGARWVPNNGGAWVNSSCWQAAKSSAERYQGMFDGMDMLA